MAKKSKSQPKSSYRSIVRRAIIQFLKTAAVQTVDLAALFLETKYKGFQLLKKGELRKVISGLVYEGDLERRGKDKYYLTQLGVIKALPEIRKELVKDGQVRILVFDIPESKRDRRDSFRRHIKLLGFKKHQQSVWVSYYNCEDWIEELLDYHKVGSYTSLYIGKHIW